MAKFSLIVVVVAILPFVYGATSDTVVPILRDHPVVDTVVPILRDHPVVHTKVVFEEGSVSCLRPVCGAGEKLEVPCCPICVPDCAAVSCLLPVCKVGEKVEVPKGECCPICVPDCAAVICLLPVCKAGEKVEVPKGECCPICVPDCAAVSCLLPVCKAEEKLEVPEGECCPICIPDCAAVSCLRPVCKAGEKLDVPQGECCPICVNECEILGQTFSDCASPCPRTCENPNPLCIALCVFGCMCPSGEVVDTAAGKCVPQELCPPRASQCAAITCQSGSRCEVLNGEAFCEPDCSLNNGGCLSNQTCRIETAFCIRAPCPSGIICEDLDPCAAMKCTDGSHCEVFKGEAFCEPDCSLNNGGCPLGQTCRLQDVTCKTQPCPHTRMCECPQECSKKFCRKNRNAICSNSGPREVPGCTGTCQLTYCNACYFAPEPLPRPGSCSQCSLTDYQSDTMCFRNWSACIKRAHRKENRLATSRRHDNFRCYSPEYPLRG